MPFSGPFVQTETRAIPGGYNIRRERYRQKVPYVDRLPYLFGYETNQNYPKPGDWNFTTSSFPGKWPTSATFPSCYAKAYGKFIEQAKQSVNLAVNIAERKQAVDMIAKRSMQMLTFARHLRAFRFGEAASTLGITVLKTKKSRRTTKLQTTSGWLKLKHATKSFGNNYLEFHFGWEPLIKDIGDSVEILHDDPFLDLKKSIKVSASETQVQPAPPNPNLYYDITNAWWPKATVKLMATVKVTDPNIFRLNQMGFVNPAVVLWELVPFSFVVDWFANVGQVLSAYTDTAGFALENAAVTVYAKYKDITYRKGRVPLYGSSPTIAVIPVYGKEAIYVRRTQGITAPKLTFKPVKWPSVTRGLTSVSLLAQFLRK